MLKVLRKHRLHHYDDHITECLECLIMPYLELKLEALEVFHVKAFQNVLYFVNIFVFLIHNLQDLIFDFQEFL